MINWHNTWNKILDIHPSKLGKPVRLEEQWVGEDVHPLSALGAWEDIWANWPPSLGQEVALTAIETPSGIYPGGVAAAWAFDVDLLDCQAKARIVWELIWDGAISAWTGARMEITASPYPMLGSPVHRIVAMGYSSARLLDEAWKQMREKAMDMPKDFIDSTEAARRMQQQGLDLIRQTGKMWTARREGKLMWVCQCGSDHLTFLIDVDPMRIPEFS